MELPEHVHVVTSRGKRYYYYQPGRNTPRQAKSISLPSDPRDPTFWAALREAQGLIASATTDTVSDALDAFLASPACTGLAPTTQAQYRLALKVPREAWGGLAIAHLRPIHVQTLIDSLAASPGKANNVLGALRAFSAWGRPRDIVPSPITEGVKAYEKKGGHKPWTPAQIAAAHERLSGAVRRGVLLALYTGQRGSDVVRLGFTDIDEGGFHLHQRKTGREVFCPILPELEAEMARWERRPGPFLLQANGKPYSRKLLDEHFAEAREEIEELAGASLHGLRSTAVIRLRRAGLSSGNIGDIIGMSLAMIERYCRFTDIKASAKAAVVNLREHAGNKFVKR